MKILILLLLVSACTSCSTCVATAGMEESKAKSILLACKGEPIRRSFEEPGGPFTRRTEIWDYSPSKTVRTDDFWFSGGELSVMPHHSKGIKVPE
jgi:hypothetical protein